MSVGEQPIKNKQTNRSEFNVSAPRT